MNFSDNKVFIRQAVAADANLVSVLGAVTFYQAYFEQDTSANLANYCAESFALNKIREELENPNSTFFILYLNEKAVGYAKLRNAEKPAGVAQNSIELQRIYLLERFWGKSVGALLLNHCLKSAQQKGFQALWLGVWEENKRAQNFYEKFGFRQVGNLTFPYGDTVGINLVLETEL